jgi:hypothetical protein
MTTPDVPLSQEQLRERHETLKSFVFLRNIFFSLTFRWKLIFSSIFGKQHLLNGGCLFRSSFPASLRPWASWRSASAWSSIRYPTCPSTSCTEMEREAEQEEADEPSQTWQGSTGTCSWRPRPSWQRRLGAGRWGDVKKNTQGNIMFVCDTFINLDMVALIEN